MNLFKAFHDRISINGGESTPKRKAFAFSAVMSPFNEAPLAIWSMTC